MKRSPCVSSGPLPRRSRRPPFRFGRVTVRRAALFRETRSLNNRLSLLRAVCAALLVVVVAGCAPHNAPTSASTPTTALTPSSSTTLAPDDSLAQPTRTAALFPTSRHPKLSATLSPSLPAGDSPLHWTTYTTRDGLPHDEVWSAAAAPDGALWFATSDGVARFDGETWASYQLADDNGVGRHVRSIAVALDGAVWVGTYMGGVSWSRGGAWTTHRTPIELDDGPIANDVQVVHVTPAGVLWVGTRIGLSRFDGETWRHFDVEDGLAGFDVLAIAEGTDGDLWVGTRGGFMDPTGGGISRFDGEVWTTLTEADGLAENYVQAIAVGPEGAVWIGMQSLGVSRLTDGWETYTQADGLPGDDVTALAVADDGSLWLGTRGGGAAQFDGWTWVTYTEADGLASNDVRAIVIGPDGAIWFATAAGVSRLAPTR